MVIVTQPSHFQVTSEAEVPFISKAGGGNGKMGPRRWLARGLPGDVYEYSPTFNSSYIIYDEYGGSIPVTPALPTAGRLWLKPNTFLSVHSFSIQNNFPLGSNNTSMLPGYKVLKATRVRDVPGESFYIYPNFTLTDTLSSTTKTFLSDTTFKDVLLAFLETKYNLVTFPTKFSVKLFISWSKWTNKTRIPAPTYGAGPIMYGRRWYLRSATWATDPAVTVGVGILHSIYIYR